MKNKSDFLKNMIFSVKNDFSGILKFLQIFWSASLFGSCLLILSRNGFKGPLIAKKMFDLESITYSVKQREKVFAGP